MSEKVTVIGAGMAGLLAANMLRSDCLQIVEQQQAIPNNHSALLRFRSNVVGDVLGIEFKRVKVMKASVPWQNPVADALSYSFKTNGSYTLRSSVSAQGEIEDRFIAPNDLIQRMVDRLPCQIRLGEKADLLWYQGNTAIRCRSTMPIISTMPMPALMKALEYPRIGEVNFKMQHGVNINVTLNKVDAYCTLYIPSPRHMFNRISITGNRLTIEFAGITKSQIGADIQWVISTALMLFGIAPDGAFDPKLVEVKEQKFAKILPIDEGERKRFMIWATDQHNIYSLGRFATWRTGLLLDDVVHDVRVIRRMIDSGHAYDHRKG